MILTSVGVVTSILAEVVAVVVVVVLMVDVAAHWRMLHGQRTGAFPLRPLLRPYQEDRPIPTRHNPDLRTWTSV